MTVSSRQKLLPGEGRFAVKRKRFSVKQIIGVLKQAEVSAPVVELIRQVGITEQALFRWKKQYKDWNPVKSASSSNCRKPMVG
jgi:putative transposase